MNDAFIAFAGGTRFVGVHTRDDNQLVGYFVSYFCQTVVVFQNGVFVICGARSYDNKKFIGIPGKNFCDFCVALFLISVARALKGYCSRISVGVGSFLTNSRLILFLLYLRCTSFSFADRKGMLLLCIRKKLPAAGSAGALRRKLSINYNT